MITIDTGVVAWFSTFSSSFMGSGGNSPDSTFSQFRLNQGFLVERCIWGTCYLAWFGAGFLLVCYGSQTDHSLYGYLDFYLFFFV